MSEIYGRFLFELELAGDIEIQISSDGGSSWSASIPFSFTSGAASSNVMTPGGWCGDLASAIQIALDLSFPGTTVAAGYLAAADTLIKRRDTRLSLTSSDLTKDFRIRNAATFSDLEAFGGLSSTDWIESGGGVLEFAYLPKGVWTPPLYALQDNRSYPVKEQSRTQAGMQPPLYIQHAAHTERMHEYWFLPGEYVREDALDHGYKIAGQPVGQGAFQHVWEALMSGTKTYYTQGTADAQISGLSSSQIYLQEPDTGHFADLLSDVSRDWGREVYNVMFKTRDVS